MRPFSLPLFSNTKRAEYRIQNIIRIDFTGNLSEVIQGAADINSEQITGESGFQPMLNVSQCL
jgi:hypothetical protein